MNKLEMIYEQFVDNDIHLLQLVSDMTGKDVTFRACFGIAPFIRILIHGKDYTFVFRVEDEMSARLLMIHEESIEMELAEHIVESYKHWLRSVRKG